MVRRPQRTRSIGIVALGGSVLIALTACDKAAAPAAVIPPAGTTLPVSPAPDVPPDAVWPSLLINQQEPFAAAKVERVRRLKPVTGMALIGYAPVWIYDQQVPTAAIDPLTYRPFTPDETRRSAAVWSAVTEGEALVSHTVGARDRLPLDASVPAGWASVRISGLATTVPGIDMVVSSKTGSRIGVPYGNGLVLAVSGDPARVVPRIRRVLGPKATIRSIVKAPPVSTTSGASSPGGPLLPVITPGATPATPAAQGSVPAPAAPIATVSALPTRRG